MDFKFLYTIHPDVVQLNTSLYMNRLQNLSAKDKNSIGKIRLYIKLAALLSVLFCCQASAKNQRITLSLQNTTLEKVFSEIKNQTQYRFIYTEEELIYSKPVSISVKDSKIEEVLSICFRDQPFSYKFAGIYIIVKIKKDAEINYSSAVDITGRVTNEKDEPLPGATITVRNLERSVITNENGEFSLTNLPEGSILIITNVGYEPFQYRITGKSNISIKLKPVINELDEVTVKLNTGFQQIPKERATGSFTFIDSKKFNQQVSTGIIERLEAVTNGLYVDRSTTTPGLRIRGLSTIRGPKSPLIIVDNFPFEGDLENLNPNDVENITILKDAAAASIWGTKAGNGVIVITMKKGRFNQPLTSEFNINTTIVAKPDLSYLKQASANDYIDAELFLFNKGYRFSDTNNVNHPPFSPVYEWLFKKRNGTVSATEADAAINRLRSKDVRSDFKKYVYRSAVNQQYSFTTRAGTSNHSWLLSGSYDRNIDNLSANYQREAIRFQNNFRITKKLLLTTGVTFSETNTKSGGSGYGTVSSNIGLYPYAELVDESGNALPIAKQYRLPFIDTLGKGKLLDWKYYPITNSDHETQEVKTQNTLLNIGLDYTIVKGLNINLLYQLEREDQNSSFLFDNNSYYARDIINTFTQINNTTGVTTYKVPVGGIIDVSNESLTGKNFRAGISYSKTWLKSDLSIIAGNEIRERVFTTGGFRTYGFIDNPLSSGIVDNVNQYPSFITGSSMSIPSYSGSAFSQSLTRFVSIYSNAAYNLLKKYTLSVSTRRDASNQFGVSTNNKWTPLWSAGLGYQLSNEKFYRFRLIPVLKFRATIGFSGNVNPSRFGSTTTTSSGYSPYTQATVYTFLSFYNPDLRWEKVRTANLGLDFSVKNNRLTGSIDYYVKKAVDLFGTVPIDYTAGIGTTVEKNVASMISKGFDIDMSAVVLNKQLKWLIELNVNYNIDFVTSYYLSTLRGSNFVGKRNIISGLEGKPVYAMFAYQWAGLDPATGDPRGLMTGILSKDYSQLTGSGTLINDLVYFGPVLPKYFGSLGNTFIWKNLSFSARFTYKFGHYFRRPGIEYNTLTTSTFQHEDLAARWRNTGDELITNIPSMPYPNSSNRDAFYLNSEIMVEKADHVRLQFITVNYTFPLQKIKASKIKKLETYFNANNIGLLWTANKYGIDPEYISNLQPSRSFSLGLKISF